MKKGINHWCFPSSYGVEAAARLAAQAGFQGFEMNVALPPVQEGARPGAVRLTDNLGLHDSPSLTVATGEAEARRLAQAVRDLGLELPSLSTSLLWQFPLSHPDEAVRQQGVTIVETMLQLAEWMGIDAILVVPGLVTADSPYQAVWDRSLEALKHLAGVAARHRVAIGVENVWNKFLLSPLEFRRFLETVDSPWVGAYFDIGNVLVNGYPDQWIRILGPFIRRCHVKDFRTDIGNIQGFVPLLQGHVPWKAVVQALEEIGYDGYLTAELSPYPSAPDKLVFDTSTSLDRILAKSV